MLTLHEIKPRQIRALLLLLMLAPMIPTGLLLRFMFDTVQQERVQTRETIASGWQDSLTIALRTLDDSLRSEIEGVKDEKVAAARIAAELQHSFEHQVYVRITKDNGTILTGEDVAGEISVASASLTELLPGTTVELFLEDRSVIRDALKDQIQAYKQTAIITITANIMIGGLAGWAFLRQVKRQELRSTTLATLAHELRTPVASMRLLLDTIREGRCPDEAEYLSLIDRENARLARLVDQFLTHSRLELGVSNFEPVSVDPEAVVVQAEENLRGRLSAPGSNYRRKMENDLPTVEGDAEGLTCVLDNLLDNAWKYSGAEKTIELRVSKSAGGVEFAVSDNGIGMAVDDQKTIFEQFHQIDNRLSRGAEGCGLGLSIVKRIVEIHRGRIRVESTPGKGSCFTVWVPGAKAS